MKLNDSEVEMGTHPCFVPIWQMLRLDRSWAMHVDYYTLNNMPIMWRAPDILTGTINIAVGTSYVAICPANIFFSIPMSKDHKTIRSSLPSHSRVVTVSLLSCLKAVPILLYIIQRNLDHPGISQNINWLIALMTLDELDLASRKEQAA